MKRNRFDFNLFLGLNSVVPNIVLIYDFHLLVILKLLIPFSCNAYKCYVIPQKQFLKKGNGVNSTSCRKMWVLCIIKVMAVVQKIKTVYLIKL